MFPLTYTELKERFDLIEVLSFGSLPKIFSFSEERDKTLFLNSYAETYLKEEILIEQLVRKVPPFKKFLEIAAAQDTEQVSLSNTARDIHSDVKIVGNYYSILEDTLLGFFLEPYKTSVRKKQKKSSKFYWFDTGVRRALSGNLNGLIKPQSYEYGSLFESFIINEIFRMIHYLEKNIKMSFLRVDEKNEIDLVLEKKGEPITLIEIKSTDRINDSHLKSLMNLRKDLPKSNAFVFSNDKSDKVIDGVNCLHWMTGLKEIGLG